MTDHDMRALALNLAHGSERFPAEVLKRAREYYAFLSGRDEAKANRSASMMTTAEIRRAQDAQRVVSALNPYAASYDQT